MDGNWIAASVPEPIEPKPEVREPTELEKLQQQLQQQAIANDAQLKKQAAEAHKKITEMSEQLRILNQTTQDLLARQVTPEKQNEAESPSDWDGRWRQLFGNQEQVEPTKEDPVAKPDEVEEFKGLVRDTMQEVAYESHQAQLTRQQEEAQLVERFRTEEKDLHPYAPQVVEQWKVLAAANPELPLETRYRMAVATCKRMFLSQQNHQAPTAPGYNGGYSNPAPQRQASQGQADDPTLQQFGFTGHFGESLAAEEAAKERARKALEDEIREERRLQATRRGFEIRSVS